MPRPCVSPRRRYTSARRARTGRLPSALPAATGRVRRVRTSWRVQWRPRGTRRRRAPGRPGDALAATLGYHSLARARGSLPHRPRLVLVAYQTPVIMRRGAVDLPSKANLYRDQEQLPPYGSTY